MTKTVELIFDFVSPNAYLAWYPLKELAARTGAEIAITPVFLGGMHKLTGNAPPFIRDADVKGKNEYAALEMRRFIAKHDLDRFRLPANFPFNTVTLQRLLLTVEGEERLGIVELLLPAIFEDGVDATDPEAIGRVLEEGGFDAVALLARTQDPSIKQQLVDNTQAAVDRGAFGIPTFFVAKDGRSEMYFGKERLGQIEEELAST